MLSSPLEDRLFIGSGIMLAAGPWLLDLPIGQPPGPSLIALGTLLAGTAATATCGRPAAAAGAALVFGTGAVTILPSVGGLVGLLFNLIFLTVATLIAARYFRQAEERPNH